MEQIPRISFRQTPRQRGIEIVFLPGLTNSPPVGLDHNPHQPHRLGFFAILLISEGRAQHQVDFETYDLSAGDYLFISKGQIHAFDPEGQYGGHLLIFTEKFLQTHITQASISRISRLYNYFCLSPHHHYPEESHTFVQSIETLSQKHDGPFLEHMLGAALTIFLLKMESVQETPTPKQYDRNYELFLGFRELVEKQYTQTRDAAHYATELNVSYKLLNTATKAIINQTAKSFIDNYVILEAKRFLVSSSMTAKEIAYTCGFDEPSNFQKYFRKHTGLTPLAFRSGRHLP